LRAHSRGDGGEEPGIARSRGMGGVRPPGGRTPPRPFSYRGDLPGRRLARGADGIRRTNARGGEGSMSAWWARYGRLRLAWAEPGILEVVLERPETLNSVDAETHSELTRIWRDLDEDPAVRVVLVRGAGKAFSAGGDFRLVEAIIQDPKTR